MPYCTTPPLAGHVHRLSSQRGKAVTRYGKYTYVEYVRFADDIVILLAFGISPTLGTDSQLDFVRIWSSQCV